MKKMSEDEFFEALELASSSWHLTTTDGLRTNDTRCFCPIIVVHYFTVFSASVGEETVTFDNVEAGIAASELGLDGEFADQIIEAADNSVETILAHSRGIDRKYWMRGEREVTQTVNLRKRLVKACAPTHRKQLTYQPVIPTEEEFA